MKVEVNANKSEDGYWILGRLYVGYMVATKQDGEMRLCTSRIFATEEDAQDYISWGKAGNESREFFLITA